ncbi:MAG: hypothetical protein ABSE62_10460 [Chthoniobacteraceae bacterium]|jgi:hypothetical protein
MESTDTPSRHAVRTCLALSALAALVLTPVFLLTGCMTPEDKAFYGRGWLNPSELDEEPTPPPSFTDPTAIDPHELGPGNY